MDSSPAPAVEPPLAPHPEQSHSSRLQRVKRWMRRHPKKTAVMVLAVAAAAGAITIGFTDLKYPVLGRVWPADVTVRVTDSSSKLPVARAKVSLAGHEAYTDKTGKASFTRLQPGPATVSISRVAYATTTAKRTLGFGDTDLGDFNLKATGIRMGITVTNTLSGAHEAGVEIAAGDVQGATDAKGDATLVFPPDADGSTENLTLTKDGFNLGKATVAVKVGGQPVQAKLLPSGKAYYLSNRSGKIDLYESNLDGSEASIVLAGNGNEDVQTGLLPNVTNKSYIAMVTSRDGRRDKYLSPIHDLVIFNTETHNLTKVEDNVGFNNFRAWVGDTLVYERYPTTGDCPALKQYNATKNAGSTVLTPEAAGGCPRLVAQYDDGFLYSVRDGSPEASGLFYATPSTKPKRLSGTPSDQIVRQTKESLLSVYYMNTPTYTTTWQSINLKDFSATKVVGGPANGASRSYTDSPTGKRSVFIEERDGKRELYATDAEGKNETALTKLGAVSQFVNWVGDDYVTFTVNKADENALYVVSVKTQVVTKIADFYRANNNTYSGGNNPVY